MLDLLFFDFVRAHNTNIRSAVESGNIRQARQLIGRIRETTDPQHLAEVVGELKQAIADHVEEEETEVFPKMEQVLDASRLDAMGAEVEQLKMQS
jgi:hemerythrin superfamily protein